MTKFGRGGRRKRAWRHRLRTCHYQRRIIPMAGEPGEYVAIDGFGVKRRVVVVVTEASYYDTVWSPE